MNLAPALPPGYRLVALDSIDSTNDEANRRAVNGAPEGTVVWALEQTKGRGRRRRAWSTPRGNFAASILLRPETSPGAAAQVSFVTALAVAETVTAVLPPSAVVFLKWPNDVLVNGGKICGILLEASATPAGALGWLVVGTGINLDSHPEDTETPATDLAAEGASGIAPERLLEIYCHAFAGCYETWKQAGFAPIREAWLARAMGVGGPIRVRLEQETLEGRFAGLDPDGALVLELADGIQRRITAGDVFPALA